MVMTAPATDTKSPLHVPFSTRVQILSDFVKLSLKLSPYFLFWPKEGGWAEILSLFPLNVTFNVPVMFQLVWCYCDITVMLL